MQSGCESLGHEGQERKSKRVVTQGTARGGLKDSTRPRLQDPQDIPRSFVRALTSLYSPLDSSVQGIVRIQQKEETRTKTRQLAGAVLGQKSNELTQELKQNTENELSTSENWGFEVS